MTFSKMSKRKRSNATDITPEQVGRMYVRKNDKSLRDKPVAYTNEGKRIFAYNESGIPICYSKRPGTFNEETGESLRCQATQTLHNGRCNRHGGKSIGGVMHYNATHLRTSDCLPSHLQGDFNKALLDPDLLSLNHEIVMVDIEVKEYKQELGSDVGGAPMLRLKNLMGLLETNLEEDAEITEELLVSIVKTYNAARNRDVTNKKLHTAFEMRRRLVDTAHHREKDLKTMIKADQAIALITSIAAGCKEAVNDLFIGLEKRYFLVDKNNVNLNVHITDESTMLEKLEEYTVTGIDKVFKLDFLSDVAIKLGKLINKARETAEATPPDGNNRHINHMAIIRKPQRAGAVVADGEE